jgi:hypothetical protein
MLLSKTLFHITLSYNAVSLFSTMIDINSAYELVEKDIQYLTRLLEIIEIQDWEVFGSIIVGNPKVFQSFARSIMRSAQLNGMTM